MYTPPLSSLQSFDVNSLNGAIKGCRSGSEKNCTLPNGMAVKITPSIPRRRFGFFSRSTGLEKSLHRYVAVEMGEQKFKLRISGSGSKYKVGGKVGSAQNRESFGNVFAAMKACQNSEEKLSLLNLMISLDPRSAREKLVENSDDLGIFKNLLDSQGRPAIALGTPDKFKRYLARLARESGAGINPAQFQGTIQSVYENLKLGSLGGKVHGGERKRLGFSQSNFARTPKDIDFLHRIAEKTKFSYSGGKISGTAPNTTVQQNLFSTEAEFRTAADIKFPEGSGIAFDRESGTFANADKTMQARFSVDTLSGGTLQTMSIDQGQELGLITPEKAQELKSQGIRDFTPLYIAFKPTTSASDVGADVRNIADGVPQNVRDADILAKTLIDHLVPGVVPVFTGHSMGGMLAHAVGAKHNCASIGFNPLGLGEGVREFIDEGGGNRCEQANDVTHAECHPSFAMRGDWVSDGKGSKVARLFVKKPYIGQRYMLENRSGETSMREAHVAFVENLEAISKLEKDKLAQSNPAQSS
ncbi:MAG: hypothetical protein LBJ13_02795 [Puniceicoccales bacterium]|jgi:hypothetical protein|nr:hypothetical protein [Puniceicoccales bacterium]